MKPMSATEARRKLLSRLKELGQRLSGIEEEFLSHDETDLEDQATQREVDDVLDALTVEGEREIRMIRAALDRIDQGSYGICTNCGEPIEAPRLAALPATPFCETCARELAR